MQDGERKGGNRREYWIDRGRRRRRGKNKGERVEKKRKRERERAALPREPFIMQLTPSPDSLLKGFPHKTFC